MKSHSLVHWINPAQRAILMTYEDGRFAYLLHCPHEEAWHSGIYTCGDGLLRFLLIDLSYREDCHCRSDAVARIEMAIRQLNVMLELTCQLPDWITDALPARNR
ncbi:MULTISPECIES: hypothetical protein [unclassified Caballeronia]|uniref:hypothetical protein n=1 Tax=unclassified Caballeronia TaxID=2646786 RepID=UPI00202804F2|nr:MULTISPECIES: hypothetical protein [unclassified Caballeronia]